MLGLRRKVHCHHPDVSPYQDIDPVLIELTEEEADNVFGGLFGSPYTRFSALTTTRINSNLSVANNANNWWRHRIRMGYTTVGFGSSYTPTLTRGQPVRLAFLGNYRPWVYG